MRLTYTRDILQQAANNSKNMTGALRYLGVGSYSGGMLTHLKNRMLALGVDFSHFVIGTPVGTIKDRKSWKEILVYNDRYRVQGRLLRRALIESGVPYVCAKCGCGPEWQGDPLTLEVDHFDGNWANNVRDNLRFLCPNCHAQTPTSSNSKYIMTTCLSCGNLFKTKSYKDGTPHANYCKPACRSKRAGNPKPRPRKGSWPSPEDLQRLVWEIPADTLAKTIGVSGSAVKRMCNRLGISTPPRGYWAKSCGVPSRVGSTVLQAVEM